MQDTVLAGTLVTPEGARPGHLVLRGGRIREVVEGEEKVEARLRGIIIPPLVNAHTHLGDAVVRDLGIRPPARGRKPAAAHLRALVGPGGFKQRALASASPGRKEQAMRRAVAEMARGGTLGLVDFREEGLAGVQTLRRAMAGFPVRGMVLGRPTDIDFPDRVWRAADGFGLSSAADLPRRLLEECRALARRHRKPFAIHAGEASRSDVEGALSLEPDLLVHMVHATRGDLRRVADAGIPVVVCPRSNRATGVGTPPVREMLRAGVRVALGTDNAMLNAPDLFAEMGFGAKVVRDGRALLEMATAAGAELLGARWGLERGREGSLVVLDPRSPRLRRPRDLRSSVAGRARSVDVRAVVVAGEVWTRPRIAKMERGRGKVK
jgi:cytosine/adenosine deaminase-related metal-dependent hydrolase